MRHQHPKGESIHHVHRHLQEIWKFHQRRVLRGQIGKLRVSLGAGSTSSDKVKNGNQLAGLHLKYYSGREASRCRGL